jgi:hypothetical protein
VLGATVGTGAAVYQYQQVKADVTSVGPFERLAERVQRTGAPARSGTPAYMSFKPTDFQAYREMALSHAPEDDAEFQGEDMRYEASYELILI